MCGGAPLFVNCIPDRLEVRAVYSHPGAALALDPIRVDYINVLEPQQDLVRTIHLRLVFLRPVSPVFTHLIPRGRKKETCGAGRARRRPG
jgi:hypothetical protein